MSGTLIFFYGFGTGVFFMIFFISAVRSLIQWKISGEA